MQIISVNSVFTCKTPNSGWLNLAQVRQLHFVPAAEAVTEIGKSKDFVVVTWHNGDKQIFSDEDATAIHQVWVEATALIQQRCNCNHRFKNRRQL
ncbi:hypothetical protein I8748_22910 [Nostoc sp. CENA67]|uniref:Uncharacterized protein n=1 Tax=Amazonocrinis nigriterrae CENA67 TaxID=2794033 RepID=A0A8J7LA08_9NOST|nr:hypothetical protein [Amazonocrinis nigriterrae]MBH8564717.1 hypothetical protein [Amazonocrinis nigriterrae CENA67]MBH8564998.1 hypothetical protein [Amazonocrinis nigriterrae CENA67]